MCGGALKFFSNYGFDEAGNIRIQDYTTATGGLSVSRQALLEDLFKYGGTVVGKGKGAFTAGTEIKPGIQIDVVSQKAGNVTVSPVQVSDTYLPTDSRYDQQLIVDYSEDPTELGCSVIFVEDVLSSLSENIKTIINIKDRNVGQLVIEEGELRETDFALDHFPEAYDKESLARRLAPLNHLQNLKSSIPDSVTFMEMYHAEDFKDLHVQERWAEHAPYKSLAVPLGLRGQGDIVYLNLHEKAHGPHGLIAGTTGSGKSELIQSYILSLAVNFHPYDVAFLLIDYKGGGMANLFKELPHLLGTITNLDGAQSMRALTSINAELKRRQRLFAKYDVNHINQYQKKYKLGEVEEAMPHLFLISDEFAELKQEQPDFMSALVSTARTGRSLGIHLILATQKPTGVVNDQIWSNSRFKIALKVADRQDSSEMLHTPDAAEITQTGRAYLQVGNNEVYELFQSAWSGAEYQPDKADQGIEDHTIYAINALGQYDILNEDLSGLEDAEDIHQVPSELDAIVTNIHNLVDDLHIKPLPQPWLPPLAERISLDELYFEKPQWTSGKSNLEIVFGKIDIPSRQTQICAVHSFSKDGNIALFSGPGMGKTNFLLTVALDLARRNTPEQLNIYLLDFGTNGLLPLLNLPHVADIIYADDNEKIPKFVVRLNDEMRRRKSLFASHTVATLEAYEQVSGEVLPKIVLFIDSFEGLRGTPNELALEGIITTISRDGAGFGLYLVLTAGRLAALRASLQSNIKTKISLKLTDDSESKTIVGRTQLVIEDLPGRGLIKVDNPEIFQVALPNKGVDAFEITENLKAEIVEIDKHWKGERPHRIPIVPELLSFNNFSTMPSTKQAIQNQEFPFGISYDDVISVSIAIKQLGHILVEWDKVTARQNILRHLLDVATLVLGVENISLYNSDDMMLEHSEKFGYIVNLDSNETDVSLIAEALKEQIIEERQRQYYQDRFIFISDLGHFIEVTRLTDNDFALMYEEGQKVGIHFIFVSSKAYLTHKNSIQRYLELKPVVGIVVGMKMVDQTFFKRSSTGIEGPLNTDQIYLHYKDVQTLLKITK